MKKEPACKSPVRSLCLLLVLACFSPHHAARPEAWIGQSGGSQKYDLKDLKGIEDLERQMDDHFRKDIALDLFVRPGMVVGEVGAGEGYFVFKLAARVGPEGKVFAEDIQASSLDVLMARAKNKGYRNIQTVLGIQNDPHLPAGAIDIVFMTATFKFLKDPVLLLNNIAPCLKKNGRVIIIEPEEGRFLPITKEPFPKGILPTRQHYLEIFGKTVFLVEKTDDTTLPYETIFILALAEGRK